MISGFSIIIPTWFNLDYTKLCVESIKKHSYYNHEIILHINECKQTLQYAIDNHIKYTYSNDNIGICKGINTAFSLHTRNWIAYLNNDFYVLPGWDTEIVKHYNSLNINDKKNIWLSGTMIEPTGNNNCCIAPYDYGTNINNFKLDKLLEDVDKLKTYKSNIQGSTWPPNIMHSEIFEKIGKMDEDYIYGFGSDPDLAKRLYDNGCRDFIGIGSSLVYHFQCKSTSKIPNNGHGKITFQKKHNMSIDHFVYNILKRGQPI